MSETDIYDFEYFPTLTTERLILRQLRLDDAADLFVSWSDFEVQKYNAPVLIEVDQARASIERFLKRFDERSEIVWAITCKSEDKAMGIFSSFSWDRYHRRAEIGYDLARRYWDKAYGREAAKAVIQFGFEKMNLNRVEAYTIEDNHGSVNMLKKLGFTLEGIRRAYSWEEDGTFHDSAVFGLLHNEFEA